MCVDALCKHLVHLFGVPPPTHVLDAAVQPLEGYCWAFAGEYGRKGILEVLLGASVVFLDVSVPVAVGAQVLDDKPLGAAIGLKGRRPLGEVDGLWKFAPGSRAGHCGRVGEAGAFGSDDGRRGG